MHDLFTFSMIGAVGIRVALIDTTRNSKQNSYDQNLDYEKKRYDSRNINQRQRQ